MFLIQIPVQEQGVISYRPVPNALTLRVNIIMQSTEKE